MTPIRVVVVDDSVVIRRLVSGVPAQAGYAGHEIIADPFTPDASRGILDPLIGGQL